MDGSHGQADREKGTEYSNDLSIIKPDFKGKHEIEDNFLKNIESLCCQ